MGPGAGARAAGRVGARKLLRRSELQRIARERYSEILVFYNLDAKRIDIKFKPKDVGEPIFMVTYEPGSPYIDEEDMWRPF